MEASSFKYLGIIIRSGINWADHVIYTVRKAWKALHFIMLMLKNGLKKLTFRLLGTVETDTCVRSRVLVPIQKSSKRFNSSAEESD